jgi:hypothetical protein
MKAFLAVVFFAMPALAVGPGEPAPEKIASAGSAEDNHTIKSICRIPLEPGTDKSSKASSEFRYYTSCIDNHKQSIEAAGCSFDVNDEKPLLYNVMYSESNKFLNHEINYVTNCLVMRKPHGRKEISDPKFACPAGTKAQDVFMESEYKLCVPDSRPATQPPRILNAQRVK